jgi:Holliday junction resolvase RusA-like endonuclease
MIEIIYKTLPTHIELSKARRATYYKKGQKIPKRYIANQFDKQDRLVDNTGLPIIKNKKTKGKPRLHRITFQDFWSGNIHQFTRTKIKEQLTNYFIMQLEESISIEFPIIIEFNHYTNNKSDIDNGSFIYIKSFFDSLVKAKFIPDDNKQYIKGYSWFNHESNENKLIIRCY